MTALALEASCLGKRYRLGAKAEPYGTLRESLVRALQAPRRLVAKKAAGHGRPEFWALRDVGFEVKHGEAIGIIGRNGAGKSTLLKLLSEITEPTEGTIRIWGRVASLLEVGTGFHPELSGRENIYLNGAILGMARREIDRKFDEIVAFAEVEQFIDTQVKHYSSGMYLRLAFAVAAHLEPDILIVDEVLAVGDAAFQKKCLGKMTDISRNGRTVLFVSHNIDAVRRLCDRAIWLDSGGLRGDGTTADIVAGYTLQSVGEGQSRTFDPPLELGNEMPVRIHEVSVSNGSNGTIVGFSTRNALEVRILWEATDQLYKPRIGFVLQTIDGADVMTSLDVTSWESVPTEPGERISRCVIPSHLLNEGEYTIEVGADCPKRYDFSRSRTGALIRFEIEDDGSMSSKYYGQEGFRDGRWPGLILKDLMWQQVAVGGSSVLSPVVVSAGAVSDR